MTNEQARAKVLEKLLESLENAETGSRELDIIVTFVLGDTSTDAGKTIQLLVEEDYPWSVIAELLDEDLPRYTESLDTRVPGEAITLSAYSRKRDRWFAVHRPRRGSQAAAWAATESLARRLAALKGWARVSAAQRSDARLATPAGEPSPAADKRHHPPSTGAVATAELGVPDREDEEGTEEEWKILF